MAAGVPVVATDIPGTRELVVPGETGFLVAVGHRAGFARWTNQLLDDAALARRLGQAARERAGREFSVEAMVSRYVELYGEMALQGLGLGLRSRGRRRASLRSRKRRIGGVFRFSHSTGGMLPGGNIQRHCGECRRVGPRAASRCAARCWDATSAATGDGRRRHGTGFAPQRQTRAAPREPWSPQALAAAGPDISPLGRFMHARELVELAAIVSAHGPVLIRGTPRLSSSGVQQYWTESKCRLDRWFRSLGTFAHEAPRGNADAGRRQWPTIRGVLEEILLGEMLTRVWATVLCAFDRRQGTLEAEPIARSVMIGHLEARHRVLILVGPRAGRRRGIGRPVEPPATSDRTLDRPAGRLPRRVGQDGQFAFEPARARDFARICGFKFLSRRASCLAAGAFFVAGGLPARANGRKPQRRPQCPHRVGHPLLLPGGAVRFDRAVPLSLAAASCERHGRRPRDDCRVALPRAGIASAGRKADESARRRDTAVPAVGN